MSDLGQVKSIWSRQAQELAGEWQEDLGDLSVVVLCFIPIPLLLSYCVKGADS